MGCSLAGYIRPKLPLLRLFWISLAASQIWLKQRRFGGCVYFSPKVSEIGNELSLTQSSMKPKNLNQYFCPVSLQSLGCNYCKCHGNKRSGFHSDSSHCRNSITRSKNYLSVPCYVHLNPACSFHCRVAANTMLLHALSLLTPGLANQVFIQSPPLWSLNTHARCCNPRNSKKFFQGTSP